MNDYYRTNRRQLLQIGAASLGLVATGLKPALADVIAEATKTAKGPIISGLGKAGPYRIGFSNGFSGNSWRAMCLAQLKIEAAKHKDISDFIVVDGATVWVTSPVAGLMTSYPLPDWLGGRVSP